MRKVKWGFFGLVVACSVVIVFRNLEEVDVELVFATLKMRLATLLAATLLTGFLLGLSASTLLKMRSWRAQARKVKSDASHTAASDE